MKSNMHAAIAVSSIRKIAAVIGIAGLAACAQSASVSPSTLASLQDALAIAQAAEIAYAGTKLPDQNIVANLQRLTIAAEAAVAVLAKNPSDITAATDAEAAVAALTTALASVKLPPG